MKIVKEIVINLLTLLALVVGLLLVVVGYSDRVSPEVYPLLACVGMAMPAAIVLNIVMLLVMLSVRWRRAWIPLAAFVVAYVPIRTYVPLHFNTVDDAEQEGCLRLMTYNVCGYGGNYKYEQALDTVTDYIMAQNVDIVCIQEEQATKHKPVERWKELYPYNDTLTISKNNPKGLNIIGIHSRLPIIRYERIEYESKTNGSVAYFLQSGPDTIIVINNHLESTHLTEKERTQYSDILKGKKERQQAEEELFSLIGILGESMVKRAPAAEAVHRYVEAHSQYPIIVCGDFNDTPISYTRHVIAEGLTDCFVEAGCGLGLSYNRKGFNFRIDHIFCSRHFTPIMCKVDSKMDASDHYPMVCSMKMNNKP